MNHNLAVSKAQYIDKKLDTIIEDFFCISRTFEDLGLPNMAFDFKSNAEKYRMLQLVVSRAMATEFQHSATSGTEFKAPVILDCFTPQAMELVK